MAVQNTWFLEVFREIPRNKDFLSSEKKPVHKLIHEIFRNLFFAAWVSIFSVKLMLGDAHLLYVKRWQNNNFICFGRNIQIYVSLFDHYLFIVYCIKNTGLERYNLIRVHVIHTDPKVWNYTSEMYHTVLCKKWTVLYMKCIVPFKKQTVPC